MKIDKISLLLFGLILCIVILSFLRNNIAQMKLLCANVTDMRSIANIHRDKETRITTYSGGYADKGSKNIRDISSIRRSPHKGINPVLSTNATFPTILFPIERTF